MSAHRWFSGGGIALKDISYRESKPRSARVHTSHIHVGSEERYFAVFILVSFHTLKKCLGILQND